jgi:hypothetical protein
MSRTGILVLVFIMVNCGLLKLLLRFHIIGLSVNHLRALAADESREPPKRDPRSTVNAATSRFEMSGAKVV